ncbi:hypothetical protein EJB05_00887, partial [Eragrostis curvula]
MASAARRARGTARRPFAVLASPSPARNNRGAVTAENVAPAAPEATPFAQRVRRFGKCAGGGKAVAKKLSSPVSVSRKPAATAIRRRVSSFSTTTTRCSTPAAAAAAQAKAHDPLRAPLWDFSGKAVRANLSSPFDEADHRGRRQERMLGGDGGEGEAAAAARKRTARSVAMEEAMANLPEPGEGRVKYLVDTFERLLSLADGCGGGPKARSGRRTKSEVTPVAARASSASSSRTPPPPAAEVIDVSYPSSEVSFPAIAGVACILDASDRTSMIRAVREQRRQRRYNSTGSSQRTCSRKVITVTSQRPFNLRTEQRGKAKEENFIQRMRKMQLEEEMMRNPLAQGLPFTTDEPENPVKPPTKEPTEPIDVVLHSDLRAVGRAKFDHQVSCTLRCSCAVDEFLRAMHRLSSILQVAERTSFMEEVRLAKERQQKMDEEIEIKQLRKEQVPRAHPMPDFTKPFVPKRYQISEASYNSQGAKISPQIDEEHLKGVIGFENKRVVLIVFVTIMVTLANLFFQNRKEHRKYFWCVIIYQRCI